MSDYKRVKRELRYSGKIIDFYSDYIELPNKKVVEWDFIKHKGAAAIVPVDKSGNIIMVRQYRNAVERTTLEIPAGGVNTGEDMKTCASRELEEETGYVPKNVEHLIDMYTTVAFCNEKIGIYYATELEKSTQNLDEDEFVNVEKYSVDELVQMILDGVIQDAKTITAIFAYKAKTGR